MNVRDRIEKKIKPYLLPCGARQAPDASINTRAKKLRQEILSEIIKEIEGMKGKPHMEHTFCTVEEIRVGWNACIDEIIRLLKGEK